MCDEFIKNLIKQKLADCLDTNLKNHLLLQVQITKKVRLVFLGQINESEKIEYRQCYDESKTFIFFLVSFILRSFSIILIISYKT